MANTFKLRNCCPTCGSNKLIELAEIDYADPRMMSYLSGSYVIDTREFTSIAKDFRTTNYGGTSKKEILKSIFRPFYRRYFSNIIFLKKMLSN